MAILPGLFWRKKSPRLNIEFSFNSLSIRRLIFLIFIIFTAFSLKYVTKCQESYWTILSAFLLCQIGGLSFKERLVSILMTTVIAALIAFLAGLLPSVLWSAFFLLLLTGMGVFLGLVHPKSYFPSFIVIVLGIVSLMLPVSFSFALKRFLFVLAGGMLVFFSQLIFLHRFWQNELRSLTTMLLNDMRKLSDVIFACMLQPEFIDNLYLFEKQLHVQKNRVLSKISLFLKMTQTANPPLLPKTRQSLDEVIVHFERLYANLSDCAQLRRRVSDHTIFLVVAAELRKVCSAIESLFNAMIYLFSCKTYAFDIPKLKQSIELLEDNYQRALQVTAREPLVFLLFIANLQMLASEFDFFFKNELMIRNLLKP